MKTVLSLPIQETLARSTLLIQKDLPYHSHMTIHRSSSLHPIMPYVYSFSNRQTFKLEEENTVNNYTDSPLDDFILTSNLAHFYPTTTINHTRKVHYAELTKRPTHIEINSGTKTIVEERLTYVFRDSENDTVEKKFSVINPDLSNIQTHASWLDFLPLSSDQENPIHLAFQNKINSKINLSVFYGILSSLSSVSLHYLISNIKTPSNTLALQDASLMSFKRALEWIITRKGNFNDECLAEYTTRENLFIVFDRDEYKPEEQEYLNKIYPVFKFIFDNIFMQETKRYIFYTDNINNHLVPNENIQIIPFSNIVPDTKEKAQSNVADKVIVFKNITDLNVDTFEFINEFDTYLTEEELPHDRTNSEKV